MLIIIGVVALLIQAGTISGYEFWDWYVRWWPLLLIGLGLALLGEWYLQQGDPYSRRTGVGGLVFLIVLLAVLGVVGKHAMNSPFGWHFSDDDDNNWSMRLWGPEHDADHQFDQAFGANGKLTIDNPHGDVSISPSTDDRIHVSAHETVHTSSDRDADKQLDKLRPALEVNGNEATLKTQNIDRGSVDLTVQVPANTSIAMKAGRGNIAVSGLNGTIGVDAGHGNVTLNKIGGACTAHMSGGDFSAHALTSTLSVSGRTEDANISDVTGRVTLDGDFLGEVNAAKLGAPLTFHSSRTTFEVDRPGRRSVAGRQRPDAEQREGPGAGGDALEEHHAERDRGTAGYCDLGWRHQGGSERRRRRDQSAQSQRRDHPGAASGSPLPCGRERA